MEKPEARQHQENQAAGTSQTFFWNVKSISLRSIIVPDILHTISLDML
jgi:hypothetical protein